MRIDKPAGRLRKQVHTTVPVVTDATLVDDTVALVDSTTALSGGQTTSIPVTRQSIVQTIPRASIRKRR